MTINSTIRTAGPFIGNGIAQNFPFSFKVFSRSDLLVAQTVTATGIETIKTLDADYTVTLNNNQDGNPGGVITMLTPPPVGTTLAATSNIALVQPLDLTNQGGFYPKVINDALDRIMINIQQLSSKIGQGIGIGLSSLTDSALAAVAMAQQLAQPAGATGVGFIHNIAGAVARTLLEKSRDIVDVRDLGVIADGNTDQTTKLVSVLTALGNAGFRGPIKIPYNTKFTIKTVFAATPVGVVLEDWSSINWGQPPGYRNRFRLLYSGDSVSDDTQEVIASGHHPSLLLNNFGTAGSSSAADRYSSMSFGAGQRWNNDPIIGVQYNVKRSPSDNTAWRISWILGTSPQLALNSQKWVAGMAVVSGTTYVDTDDGNAYVAASSGNAGATKPTHIAGTVSDGGVSWTYVSPWDQGSTRLYFDTNGIGAFSGKTSAQFEINTDTPFRRCRTTLGSDGTIAHYDSSRNVNYLLSTVGYGTRLGGVPSYEFVTVSGPTPAATTSGMYVNNAVATNMTDIVLPDGQTEGIQVLWFNNANTTLKYAGSSFILKGGVDVTPPANGIMVFIKKSSLSGNWVEVSRSF